jgi:hypothetical protein
MPVRTACCVVLVFLSRRFGKFNRILDAGLHFLIPVVSSQLLQDCLSFDVLAPPHRSAQCEMSVS